MKDWEHILKWTTIINISALITVLALGLSACDSRPQKVIPPERVEAAAKWEIEMLEKLQPGWGNKQDAMAQIHEQAIELFGEYPKK